MTRALHRLFFVCLRPPRVFVGVVLIGAALGACAGAGWALQYIGAPTPSELSARHQNAVSAQRDTSDTHLIVAIGAEPSVLDPHDAGDAPSTLVNFHLYDRLVELDDAMTPRPSLASEWDVSPDQRVWRLFLRKGVRFHDGAAFDAAAVVANFERLMDPNSGLARRSLIGDYIEGVKELSSHTVEVRLHHPVGGFLRLLAHEAHGMISPRAIATARSHSPFKPVGTGPFMLDTWIPGTRLTLRRFDGYWNGPPATERLDFLTVPDSSNRAIMLETGTVHLAYPLDPFDRLRLERIPGVVALDVPSQRMIYLAVNLHRPQMKEARTRRAISLGIDRDAITQHVLFGMGRSADSPIAPETWGHHSRGPLPYDPLQAESLVHAAFGSRANPPLQIWSPSNRYTQDRVVAQAVAAYLQEIGFSPSLKLFEWGAYLSELRRSDDWDLALLGWVPSTGDADMALRPLFESTARGNHSGYSSARVDALLTLGAESNDSPGRLDTYRQVQEELLRDLPAIWLYTVDMMVGYRTNVKGVRIVSTEVLDLRRAHVEGAVK